ncbi:MAG: hypothetical protein AABY32_06515 [Nanoarchaeota archaeon]
MAKKIIIISASAMKNKRIVEAYMPVQQAPTQQVPPVQPQQPIPPQQQVQPQQNKSYITERLPNEVQSKLDLFPDKNILYGQIMNNYKIDKRQLVENLLEYHIESFNKTFGPVLGEVLSGLDDRQKALIRNTIKSKIDEVYNQFKTNIEKQKGYNLQYQREHPGILQKGWEAAVGVKNKPDFKNFLPAGKTWEQLDAPEKQTVKIEFDNAMKNYNAQLKKTIWDRTKGALGNIKGLANPIWNANITQ